MGTINFDKDDFATLQLEEFVSQWNPIALDELADSEQDIIMTFWQYASNGAVSFNEAGEIQGLDATNILLVKAGAGGILDRIYGPSIFKSVDDEHIVLKMGNNTLEVVQTKDGLKVGQLEGSIRFSDEPIKVKIKNDKGEEEESEFYPGTVEFLPEDGEEWMFNVRLALDPKTSPQPVRIKQAIKKGSSILEYLANAPTPSNGIDTMKMQDLGVGEFGVADIQKVNTQNYGDRFILELTDGRKVWSRGGVDTLLKSGWEKPEGQPLTLQIAEIEQRGNKYFVSCSLRLREPRLADSDEVKPTATKKPNVKPVTPAKPQKELVAAGTDSLDDIPF